MGTLEEMKAMMQFIIRSDIKPEVGTSSPRRSLGSRAGGRRSRVPPDQLQ